ncbi:hypothetical protein BDU57DRAFT_268558 [Ampelomyces quisqualis]|uniref:Uncharacterized protein n=1 Tax=Ampelomyces quisqualis TaxID=50730 RepID=A0A6A5QKD0_AMPQU|nr:hypothetical protein BDU57DRAFT_268558 [Ampelomyces quisqualis]
MHALVQYTRYGALSRHGVYLSAETRSGVTQNLSGHGSWCRVSSEACVAQAAPIFTGTGPVRTCLRNMSGGGSRNNRDKVDVHMYSCTVLHIPGSASTPRPGESTPMAKAIPRVMLYFQTDFFLPTPLSIPDCQQQTQGTLVSQTPLVEFHSLIRPRRSGSG